MASNAEIDSVVSGVEGRIRDRLGELSARLGDADWLDGAFSASDVLMVTVLRRLNGSGMLDPNLSAYVVRGEARPAFKRAFDAQLAVFTAASTADGETEGRTLASAEKRRHMGFDEPRIVEGVRYAGLLGHGAGHGQAEPRCRPACSATAARRRASISNLKITV